MNKIIHYCWFGRGPIPKRLQDCMSTWKKFMPEWKVMRWDEDSFDVNSTQWTKGAYEAKKYAFVSDYVRLFALKQYGGIYFDTDVKLLKNLEPLTEQFDTFMGFERPGTLTSAVIYSSPNHPLICEFLEHYNGKIFTDAIVTGNEANVIMMTDICEKYGLIRNDAEQMLRIGNEGNEYFVKIFTKDYFCPLDFWHNLTITENSYAIHLFDASWIDDKTKKRITRERNIICKAYSRFKSILWELMHHK